MTGHRRLAALFQWIALGIVVGLFCGAASAVFLAALAAATSFRDAHEIVVYALPIAGLVVGFLYERYGQPIKGGNNLIIDTIHDDGPEIPLRMAPMVLIGTVLTHLFGGSAGREGTAVQMGASLTDAIAHRLRLEPHTRRELLAAGVAGGFGSVFGTPIAGMIFGLEFVVLGRIEYDALVPALVASVVGDMTTRALGIVHTVYPQPAGVALSPALLGKWLVVAAFVAGTTALFIESTHRLKRLGERFLPRLPLRMALGGAAVLLMWHTAGTSEYLGLSLPLIAKSFTVAQPWYAFLLKLAFTAVTLGSGFLGGEVTPLFCVGAALGSWLAAPLGLPLDLTVAVGLAAVFASASNTPLALSVMAVEICGPAVLPHVVIVCVLAYILSGHRSIYPAQRLLRHKSGTRLTKATPIRELGD